MMVVGGMLTKSQLIKYAWFALAVNLAVIIWGAFVRASGSGAGCGDHWPLCNGQVVPQSPLNTTLIEFAHRLTSGLAVITVALLVVWAFRAFPKGYGVRGGALLALLAIIIESAIGAGLVLLRLVGSNDSFSRGIWLGAHLLNTLFLLAALSVTAWLSGANTPIRELQLKLPRSIWISTIGFLAAGVLGTFAALGDTLTVPTSFATGLQADFSPISNIFVRLRILHPLVAGAFGIWLIVLSFRAGAKGIGRMMATLVVCQFAVGLANIALKTPVLVQLLHLLIADLLWIAFVLWTCELQRVNRQDSRSPRPEFVYH
jgi:heme A synthase